jgi:hypothetical protein
MSQSQDTTDQIEIKMTRRGAQVYSYNHERKQELHIGTISGAVFEKGNAAILWSPEPSICLMPAELEAAELAGASFLRCIPRGHRQTYSISLADFRANAEPYHNAHYGEQLRCPLTAFQSIGTAKKRNAKTDNPKRSQPGEIIRQLSMFGSGR